MRKRPFPATCWFNSIWHRNFWCHWAWMGSFLPPPPLHKWVSQQFKISGCLSIYRWNCMVDREYSVGKRDGPPVSTKPLVLNPLLKKSLSLSWLYRFAEVLASGRVPACLLSTPKLLGIAFNSLSTAWLKMHVVIHAAWSLISSVELYHHHSGAFKMHKKLSKRIDISVVACTFCLINSLMGR